MLDQGTQVAQAIKKGNEFDFTSLMLDKIELPEIATN